MKSKIISGVIITVLMGIMCVSGWKIYEVQSEYQTGEETYEDIGSLVELPTRRPDPELGKTTSSENPTESDTTDWPVVDFEALQGINPDIIGWIYIEGTEINYPVVQGEDNSYYLKHLFTGEWNSSGCIFLDSRNQKDFSDMNNVIYGHHMKNGSMFSGLDSYKKQEFFDEHPTVLILTPDQNYKVEIFAGYVASIEDNAWQLCFTASGFEYWLLAATDRSWFTSEITPAVTDRIITLSTCSYEFNNARFVIHGIIR